MNKFFILICVILFPITGIAQEEKNFSESEIEQTIESLENIINNLNNLKVSGYIQGQYQYGEKDAKLGVGTSNNNLAESFNRIGIRRGRIKFIYQKGIASGVFQVDLTEKGIGFKDVYLNIKDPWVNSNQLRMGIFDRPFGFEISYSSSSRETPERSTVFQLLFPEERDMGAMLILQGPKTSPWEIVKLEAGLFAGNGIKQETDNRKDFIGHLSINKKISNYLNIGGGFSYYYGGVYQGNENVYKMKDNGFALNKNQNNIGKFAKREYFGGDIQFAILTSLGITQLRGEYILGQQPGSINTTKSPNSSLLPDFDTYIRNFSGWYVIFVQSIGTLPFSAVLKYDYYDPNTKISNNEVGRQGTTKTDLAQNTLGFGGLWNINKNLRLQAFYEINKNEKSENVAGMNGDLKNNVFTFRLQYKF